MLALAATGMVPGQGAVATTRAARADTTQVCSEGTVRDDGVLVCSAFFPEGDPIALPADPDADHVYGWFGRGGGDLQTRTGPVPLSGEVAQSLYDASDDSTASTVYLATLADGEVTGLAAYLVVEEHALMSRFFGGAVMEGTIGKRSRNGMYPGRGVLPVRIEFGSPADGDTIPGRIVNASKDIRSADGGCLRSLESRNGNPLVDPFTRRVELVREPSMHTYGDDELVLDWGGPSNMGRGFYPSMAALLGPEELARSWDTMLHGNPSYGPSLRLRFVTSGGGRCR